MAIWDTINYNIHQDSPVNWRNSDAINREATYPKPFTPPNILNVSGRVGEYGQRPGEGYNENMYTEEEKEGFLSFLKNAGVNTKDFLMNNAARYGGAMGGAQLGGMFGPIGALAGMIGGGIFGNRFTNQPYIGAGDLYHGAGGFTAAQLDRQNALGGYYSDAARNQRRNASRVSNLINRAESGKNFSRTNLKNLGGFTDSEIDNIVSGGTQISPGTFTSESIDQSFAGEEGPTTSTTSGSSGGGWSPGVSHSGAPSHSTKELMATGGIVGMYR